MADRFPLTIVSNCDQAPFFALVRQKALQETYRIGLWTTLLSEAALRSRVVAAWMNELPPADEWQQFVNDVPKKKHWFYSDIARKNFYTQALTIANGRRSIDDNKYTLLSQVKQLPPPASFRWEEIGALSLFIIMIVLSVIDTFLKTTSPLLRWSFPLLFTILYFYLLRYMLIRLTFIRVLNISIISLRSNPMFTLLIPRRYYETTTTLRASSVSLEPSPSTSQARSPFAISVGTSVGKIILGKRLSALRNKIFDLRNEGFSKVDPS